jgi:hypothetical protein
MTKIKKAGMSWAVSTAMVYLVWPKLFGHPASNEVYAAAIAVGAVLGPRLLFYVRAVELRMQARVGWITRRKATRLINQEHSKEYGSDFSRRRRAG